MKTFLNARNVSSETADSVLVNILANVEPRIKPEDAITVNYLLISFSIKKSSTIHSEAKAARHHGHVCAHWEESKPKRRYYGRR